jgi:hypothetical protein
MARNSSKHPMLSTELRERRLSRACLPKSKGSARRKTCKTGSPQANFSIILVAYMSHLALRVLGDLACSITLNQRSKVRVLVRPSNSRETSTRVLKNDGRLLPPPSTAFGPGRVNGHGMQGYAIGR